MQTARAVNHQQAVGSRQNPETSREAARRAAADFNGDGWIDIYVANDGKKNQLWINRRNGTFENAALLSGVALPIDGKAEASMGVDAGDFDDDGDEDLFMTELTGEGSNLHVNDGAGVFDDRSARSVLGPASVAFTGFGTGWFDFDGDGRLDVLSVNGTVQIIEALRQAKDPLPLHQRKLLFRDLGNGRFEDVSSTHGRGWTMSLLVNSQLPTDSCHQPPRFGSRHPWKLVSEFNWELGVIVSVLVLFVSACGSRDASRQSSPALLHVSLPDMSNAAEPVQARLREQYASLKTVADRPGAPPTELAAAYGEMGKLFIAAEFFDAAEACLVNAETLAPSEMRWPYLLGHVFRFKNDTANAARSFERALALTPDHVPSLVWLAEMHLAQSRPGAAEPLLLKAQSLRPDEGAVLYGLGRIALARQEYAAAVNHLEGALAAKPSATRVQYPLAMAYRGLGDRKKAEEHLRLRGEVDLPPSDPLLGELAGLLQNAAAYEIRGAEAIDARRWGDAIANLRKATELAPDNAFTHLNLGTSLYMTGDTPGALEQFRAAIALSPGLAKAHFAIGVLNEVNGKDPAAIEAFSAAVAADPGYNQARLSLANALRRSGRTRESLPHYAAALDADPSMSQASFGYAMALVRLRRYQEARDRLTEGTRAYKDQPGFAHALARLLAAAPDDRVRDGMRAVAIIRELWKTQQTLPTAETMAMALAEVGQFDDAIKWQRDAISAANQGGRGDLVVRLSETLRLYERQQPCRTPWADDDPVHRPEPSSP